jgi:hypothetical protein
MSEPTQEQQTAETAENSYGPVTLVQYLADGQGAPPGHLFWVNDPSKLPENAVGVRVRIDSPFVTGLFYAFDKKEPIMVVPWSRWSGPDGKLFWTISSFWGPVLSDAPTES